MKFSIAVLSSIIAVCSVTIANPVDPSSTMSAEISTPTASTSGGSASGPDSPEFPTPEGLEEYCYPFDDAEVSYINEAAKTHARIEKMFEKLEGLTLKVGVQKGLIQALERQAETQGQASSSWLDTTQFNLETEREALAKLKDEYDERKERAAALIEQNRDAKSKLKQYMDQDPGVNGDPASPKTTSAYDKCFGYFFSYYMETMP
ncbi:hypothetical protein O5D80_003853 [Batrachochytrium dendrobatidis]|nr:hypothetical protein O5D80_003853 [Batrachochytrium dendrobatidis]